MTEQQTPKLVASLVEHQTAFSSLSVEDAQWVILNTKEAIDLFVGAVQKRNKKTEVSILQFIGTVTVPATTGKFTARENFVTGLDDLVKISGLGGNFTEWFLSGRGKTEDPIGEQALRYHKLGQSSVDGPIIAELGGEEKAETTLAEVFSLMEKQKNGESGVLLTNGYANIFYVRDQTGVLRAVFVRWYGGGWLVFAFEVSDPHGWFDGGRVFSRNPSGS